jgi:hypothetical protein
MSKTLIKTLLLFPFLYSCISTTDETIMLSKNFEANSAIITLDTPIWRIPDSVYNKSVGDYSIVNTDTSGRGSKKELINRDKDTNFLNYILFDDFTFITEEYNVESTERFSFDLKKNHLLVSTSKCEILSQSSTRVTKSEDILSSNTFSRSGIETRLKTYLICAITHQNTQWQLSFISYAEGGIQAQLKSNDLSYEIKNVTEFISLITGDNGVERRNSPSWLPLKAGLYFYDNKEQVAAQSFVGKPKIWLKDSLSADAKELLLAVNYSLTMFNWLDNDWR